MTGEEVKAARMTLGISAQAQRAYNRTIAEN
jgi:hypothetical protein